jgi:hypothetical protein
MKVWIKESGSDPDDYGVETLFAEPFTAYGNALSSAAMLDDAVIEAREDGLFATSQRDGAWTSLRPMDVEPSLATFKNDEAVLVWLEETNAIINQYPDVKELVVHLLSNNGLPLPS